MGKTVYAGLDLDLTARAAFEDGNRSIGKLKETTPSACRSCPSLKSAEPQQCPRGPRVRAETSGHLFEAQRSYARAARTRWLPWTPALLQRSDFKPGHYRPVTSWACRDAGLRRQPPKGPGLAR
jgi:hypothetical protein